VSVYSRLKNRIIAKIITRFPSLSRRLVDSYTPVESVDIPWTPIYKPIDECKVSIVTTSGVHLKDQVPFDMNDPNGDPTFREINAAVSPENLMITHDYYDHSDADRDINIVFPIERLREFAESGIIGSVARSHYSFMGHIDGSHIETLKTRTAPEVAGLLRSEDVDIVLLTPG
jgi:D-proline reductase (dithiol) PrdB